VLGVLPLLQVAVRLYKGCGFQEHSDESRFAGGLTIGEFGAFKQLCSMHSYSC
jgi:hypothetical protein